MSWKSLLFLGLLLMKEFRGLNWNPGVDVSCTTFSSIWEGPEDVPCTKTIRNQFVRGAQASLKSSVIVLLCMLDLTVGATVNQLEDLNAIGMTGPRAGGGPQSPKNGDHSYHNGQQRGKMDKMF